ncbi:MAG TPA: hypothetical protein VG795_12350 [Acidimicrobiia bacterium]|nr:hypothetical protein [Acidimicrobiia bacterium]
MDESETVEQSLSAANGTSRIGIDRRAMLKAAVAAGTIAGTWVAPRIETLGFAPAAAFTPCLVTSVEDNINRNSGCGVFAEDPGGVVHQPCGNSFGNCGQTATTFTFTNPTADCQQIVVTLIDLNCAGEVNPDTGSQALIITSTTGDGCDACTIHSAEVYRPNQTVVRTNINNGPINCVQGDGIDASLIPCIMAMGTLRLRVRLDCTAGIPGCDPPTPTP